MQSEQSMQRLPRTTPTMQSLSVLHVQGEPRSLILLSASIRARGVRIRDIQKHSETVQEQRISRRRRRSGGMTIGQNACDVCEIADYCSKLKDGQAPARSKRILMACTYDTATQYKATMHDLHEAEQRHAEDCGDGERAASEIRKAGQTRLITKEG